MIYRDDMTGNLNKDIEQLNFEDFLFLVFAFVSFMNISGNSLIKEYINKKDNYYMDSANKIFEFTLNVTLIIYIYFLIRNYNSYVSVSEEKRTLYLTKLLGSCFLITGVLLLLYFQTNQKSFVGSPAV